MFNMREMWNIKILLATQYSQYTSSECPSLTYVWYAPMCMGINYLFYFGPEFSGNVSYFLPFIFIITITFSSGVFSLEEFL